MKILHLYYNLMNLYGEYGNICAVERMLQKSNVECEVVKADLNDNVNFNEYDFIYIGSGTENNQKKALDDFIKYREQLKAYMESNKTILMTGNSFEMLGKTITDSKGKIYNAMGIFDFTTVEQDAKRITGDAVFTADFTDKPLVGFINKCSEIDGIENTLFNVKMGIGNNSKVQKEGLHFSNLFATHLTGPILIKNPYFLEYIVGILSKQTTNFEVCSDYLNYERLGYEVTVRELTKRTENK